MKNNFILSQKKFFNQEKYQYQIEKIIKPPFYNQLEINYLIKKLNENRILKKNKIADFGAGTGRLTIPLLKHKFKVDAIDISDQSLKKLSLLTKKLKINKYLNLKNSLPKKEKYQAVVGCDILHHVDLKKILPQIKKSLVKNGVICFSEPNILNPSWIIFFTLKKIWPLEQKIWQSNPFYLKKILKANGFKNIKIEPFGFLPLPFLNFSKKLSSLNLSIGKLPFLNIFSYRLIIFAKK